jgi:lipid-A-disaccharide synthase
MYAARLATALKQRLGVTLFGMGGPQMRAAGVEIIADYSEVSVVGITEVLKRLPSLRRAMKRLVDEAELRRPPLAILTDFPGFAKRHSERLLRLSAILGLAAVARKSGPAPIRAGVMHLSV